MFVYLPRWGRYGTIAASCALAVGACSSPDLNSALRPDGPPEVLSVSVNAPDNRDGYAGTGGSLEQVTFCKTQGPNDGAQGAGDPKRPDEVILSDESALELCPTDSTKPVPELTNALPEAWYARIQFDELLDPTIEDLVADVDDTGAPTGTYTGTLANTQPVTLKCESATGAGMVDVPYDGYYSPAGNSISYPIGPGLVIIPNDPTVVATDSECTVTLKENITDKDGNQVPADQRGPYKFRIGAVTVLAIAPSDGDAVDPIDAGVDLTFNTAVDPDTVLAATTFTPVVDNLGYSPSSAEEYFIYGDFPSGGGPFKFALTAGAMITDQCGKATTLAAPSIADNTEVNFTTNDLALNGVAGAQEPGAKIQISFNQYMDPASLLAADYTITPAVTNGGVEYSAGLDKLVVLGDFQLGTDYTFTLKSGAMIADCPGAESATIGGPGCATSATYTAAADDVTTFTTASSIVLKSISPKDNASVSLSAAAITLTFNDDIDAASFDAADYTISPAVTLTATNLGGPLSGSYEQLELDGAFVPGTTYTFTLKGTAQLSDHLVPANNFTPGADKVIHFTVKAPSAAPPPHVCL